MSETLQNLPRDLTTITVKQFELWARELAKKTLRELRQWQMIQQHQMRMAFQKKNDLAFNNCEIMMDAASAAVAIRTWKNDTWKMHIPRCLEDNSNDFMLQENSCK